MLMFSPMRDTSYNIMPITSTYWASLLHIYYYIYNLYLYILAVVSIIYYLQIFLIDQISYYSMQKEQNEVVDYRYIDHELSKLFMPFFHKRPTSLLIKGLPGVGKTTLSLELLRMVKNYYKPLYISTRVSLEKLKIQYHWISSIIKEGDILSSDTFNRGEVIDMRLSSAKSTLEVVIEALIDNRERFIILDSWDALAKECTYEERIKMEKSMVAIADANNGFIIFISEEPEKNTLAYITDAIISLSLHIKNGFAIKNMNIDKMRGMSLESKTRLYTLQNSHFILLPYKQELLFSNKVYDTNLPEVSTGNSSLDNSINGLSAGSIILIEVSSNINREVITLFLLSFVIHNLKNNRLAFVINAPNVHSNDTLKYIKHFCNENELNNLTIFTYLKEDKNRFSHIIKFDEFSKNSDDTFINHYIGRSYNSKHPIVMTYDLGIRELWSPENVHEAIRIVNSLIKLTKEKGDILILLSRPETQTLKYAQSISDIYIKIWNESNVPLVWLRKPSCSIHAFIYDTNITKNYYELTPLI